MGITLYFDLFIIILFVAIWLGLIVFFRVKKKKSIVSLLFFTVLYIYIYKVLDYTIFQYQSLIILKLFIPDLILNGQAADKTLNLIPLFNLTSDDIQTSALNILLFIPLGFGLPFITRFHLKKVLLIGLVFSIVIELVQLISGSNAKISFRVADINDVIFNTIGVVIGYVLFKVFLKGFKHVLKNRKIYTHPVIKHISERPQGVN